MSPEQAVGKDLDPRTDIFSLGVVAHELLTGQRLFYKGNPAQEMAAVYEAEIPLPSRVNRRVSKAVDPVVMRALERKPERRYQSALDLIRDLSLAAGSTMWTKERCAEMVKGQFASRQKDIERLLARIPSWGSDADVGGRTLIGRGGPLPTHAEDLAPKTVLSHEPMGQLRGSKPVAAEPSDAPRVLRGVRANGPVETDRPTDPKREAVAKRSSTSTLVVAALAALLLGGAGGALIFKWAQDSSPPAMSRVLIEADRPTEVVLEGQSLGRTPLTAVFPVGHHVLRLKENGGRVHAYEVDVLPSVENTYHVTLDSLKEVP